MNETSYWIYNSQEATIEQMDKAGVMVRSICQPKFKIPDVAADNIKNGNFPDDRSSKVNY